jgi:DNA repair protein RadC
MAFGSSGASAALLARLVVGGEPARRDLEAAESALDQAGGLFGLATVHPLLLRPLLSDPAAVPRFRAAVEIGRRLAWAEVDRRDPLGTPDALAAHLALRWFRRDQEVAGVVLLGRRGGYLSDEAVFHGTLTRMPFEPRTLLALALAREAAGAILFHTHPSRDQTPSREDRILTRRMAAACDEVGIQLVDHLVIGGPARWASLRPTDL